MSITDAYRKWGPLLVRLKARLASRSGSLPPKIQAAVDDAVAAYDSMLQELAATQIEEANLRSRIATQEREWDYLFGVMPTACVLTDGTGTVIHANRSASQLLNVSARHFHNRLLMHFIQDRAAFGETLAALPAAEHQMRATFVVRPRERAPISVDVLVVRRAPDHDALWLWFLIPQEANSASLKPKGRTARTPMAT